VQAGKAGAESRTRCCHEQVFSLQDAQQPLRHLHSVVQGAARLHSRTFLCAAPYQALEQQACSRLLQSSVNLRATTRTLFTPCTEGRSWRACTTVRTVLQTLE